MLSSQELFDKVATHLLTQMKESRTHEGHCVYRGPDGLKCAIGALIPDDLYQPEWEGFGVVGDLADTPPPAIRAAAGIREEDRFLAGDLQLVHDSSDTHDWQTRLAEVAERYNLSTTVLDHFKEASC